MTKKEISTGVVHNLPEDLREILISDQKALEKWEDITPLARNEWICWVVSVKETGNEASTHRESAHRA